MTALQHSVARPLFWLDVAVKAALVGLLAFGAFSGLDQFEGKRSGGGSSRTRWQRSSFQPSGG